MIESHVRELQALLERMIHERGFTRPGVEKALGWKEGSLLKRLTGEEELTVDQPFLILEAIDLAPREFFAELYGLPAKPLPAELNELQNTVGSVVNLLVKNGVITADAVARAVAAQVRSPQ